MESKQSKAVYLTLEDFFMEHEAAVSPLIGERTARHAWALKDLDPSSADAERSCRLVQKEIERVAEKRKADWVIMVSENHVILSLESWIVDVLGKSREEAAGLETGYGDLDLNIETQLACGRQLESFHQGDWAKERLADLFEPSLFVEEDPIECLLKVPLPQLIAKLDRDLEIATRGGIRHPYQCSVGVGALCLRLAATEDEGEKIIPVVRRTKISDIPLSLEQMKIELKDRFKGLTATIQEQQANLRILPEGWPTKAIWDTMQEWAQRRFVGDNGLMGSELFDQDDWVVGNLPHEVHRPREAPEPEGLITPPSLDGLGQRVAARRQQAKMAAVPIAAPSARL
jgi:hypothetical protein